MFLLSVFKWGILDNVLIMYRVGEFFAMIVSLIVLLKKRRCVTEKWFLCVCLGYDWILWGVNINNCHVLNLYTSKGINSAIPKHFKLITDLCLFLVLFILGIAGMWNPVATLLLNFFTNSPHWKVKGTLFFCCLKTAEMKLNNLMVRSHFF